MMCVNSWRCRPVFFNTTSTNGRVNAHMWTVYMTLTFCFFPSRSACTVTERKSLKQNQLWPLKQSSLPSSPLRSLSPRPSLPLLLPPLRAPPLPRQLQEEGWRAPLPPGGSRKASDGHKWERNAIHVDHTSLYWYSLSGQNIRSIKWNGANTVGALN